MGKDMVIKNSEHSDSKIYNNFTRREFMRNLAVGSGLILFGGFSYRSLLAEGNGKDVEYSMILVDYSKCTGCRTCEAVCSSFNHREEVKRENLPGLGNPHLSNIRIHSYNPDVDVPNVCAMCVDSPCIEACPVSPDPKTGRKALYRDDVTQAIKNDADRCIACGECAEACKENRRGVIIPNPETNRPERMCSLCNGEPQCVAYCPYGALSHVKDKLEGKYYGMHPDRIADKLIKSWYEKN